MPRFYDEILSYIKIHPVENYSEWFQRKHWFWSPHYCRSGWSPYSWTYSRPWKRRRWNYGGADENGWYHHKFQLIRRKWQW